MRGPCRRRLLRSNPFIRPGGDESQDWKVHFAEGAGGFPCVAFLIASLEGDVEHVAFACFLTPKAGADAALADMVNRRRFGFC